MFRKRAAALSAQLHGRRERQQKRREPHTLDDRLRELWALVNEVPPWERPQKRSSAMSILRLGGPDQPQPIGEPGSQEPEPEPEDEEDKEAALAV